MSVSGSVVAEAAATRLAREAVVLGVPEALASEAARVTVSRLPGNAPFGRVDAYFWGVVRRGVIRGAPGTRALRVRLLLRSAADDLLEAGYGPHLLHAELVERFAGHVDEGLLDEYRPCELPLAG